MPETAKSIGKGILRKKILWMRKAKKLNQHVYMQCFSHLGFNDAKVRADMAKDSGSLLCRNPIRRCTGLVGAIKESADD